MGLSVTARTGATDHLAQDKVARITGGFYLAYILASVLADTLGHIGRGTAQQVYQAIATNVGSFRLGLVIARLSFGIRRARHPGLGQELAGDVESVGEEVRSLRKGDRVFAATGIGLGAYAEYICLRENPQTGTIATMPANLSYEEAAGVP